MNNVEKFMQEIKANRTPFRLGVRLGVVSSLSPLTVSIPMTFGETLVTDQLIVASRLCVGDRFTARIATTAPANAHTHVDNHTEIETTKPLLDVGDRVIVAASEQMDLFFILDKAGDF